MTASIYISSYPTNTQHGTAFNTFSRVSGIKHLILSLYFFVCEHHHFFISLSFGGGEYLFLLIFVDSFWPFFCWDSHLMLSWGQNKKLLISHLSVNFIHEKILLNVFSKNFFLLMAYRFKSFPTRVQRCCTTFSFNFAVLAFPVQLSSTWSSYRVSLPWSKAFKQGLLSWSSG